MQSESEKQLRRSLFKLCDKIHDHRTTELRLAATYQRNDAPSKAVYHTGLADGLNGITREIELILQGGESGWLRSN